MTIIKSIKLDYSNHLRVTAFPLADANGNCVTYLDEAGNVQAHYEYDAFGGTVSSPTGDMAEYFRFRFSSKYLDDETGLYYYGYRWYSPVLGRWLSKDSIWERGGLLLYGFTRNSPVCFFDFLGMKYADQNCCNKALNEVKRDPDIAKLMRELGKTKKKNGMPCLPHPYFVCGLCTQGTHGYIQDLMTPIKICYGKGGTDNVFQTVKHELQHAKDACPDNWPENCEEMVKFETRAYFCSGQCNNKKTCADAAYASVKQHTKRGGVCDSKSEAEIKDQIESLFPLKRSDCDVPQVETPQPPPTKPKRN